MKSLSKKKPTPRRRGTKRKRTQRGWGVDIQKWLAKTGIEFHWPGYQYMGPGTHLAKRLKRRDPGIYRLDKIAKQHDIDYSHSQNLQDKWKADTKMIKAIDCLPGKKTMTERVVKRIMQAKKRLRSVTRLPTMLLVPTLQYTCKGRVGAIPWRDETCRSN